MIVSDKDFDKNETIQNTVILCCPAALIMYICTDVSIHNQGFFFVLFSLLYVLFPGRAVCTAIDRAFYEKYKKWAPLIAFYFGFFIIIVQFFVLNRIRCLTTIRFIPLIIGMIAGFITRGERLKIKQNK